MFVLNNSEQRSDFVSKCSDTSSEARKKRKPSTTINVAPQQQSGIQLIQTSALDLYLGIGHRWISNTLPASRDIPPACGMKDRTSRRVLESPIEQFPALILVMVQEENVMASKETASVCQTTLLENMTPPQAGPSTAAKRDRTLLHHLDTRVLDLVTLYKAFLPARNTTMVYLIMLFARQGGPYSDRDRPKQTPPVPSKTCSLQTKD